ncbi:MAG: hypothetical protein MUF34_35445, partial [Polyangiaceae bacterium]|nr:hypothetical protein [Polyangiaceae bacterium]
MLRDTWRFDGSTWQRLCDGVGCFPARRSFTVLTKGSELSPELLVFGGVDTSNLPALSLTNRFLRFTGAGWQPLATPTPATLPTLLDGSPSFSQGKTAPAARRLAWAAAGPGGQVLLGSGESDLAGLADDDGFDVWRLVPRGSTTRWARVPVTTARPGRRIAGSAVFDPLRQETLVVGGITGFTESPTPAITYNTDPPVAYRSRGVSAS